MSRIEKPSEYIRRVIREQRLTFGEVKERSRGEISTGYLNDLLQENTTNPSVKKVQALARGLGVSEEEMFRVFRGLSIDGDDFDSDLAQLIEIWHRLRPENRPFLIEQAEALTRVIVMKAESGSFKVTGGEAKLTYSGEKRQEQRTDWLNSNPHSDRETGAVKLPQQSSKQKADNADIDAAMKEEQEKED